MELPQVPLKAIESVFNMCFGCGKDNPFGLKLKFKWDGKEARAEFTPTPNHQGWPGYVHGGILLCLLDEAFGYAAMYGDTRNSVTTSVQARLRHMATIGEPMVITGRITKNSARLIETEARIVKKDGTLITEGNSVMFVVNSRKDEPKKDA